MDEPRLLPKVRLLPQSPQNLVSAGFVLPQLGQRSGNAEPHCPQNLLPFGLMAPQPGQSIEFTGHNKIHWPDRIIQ